MCTSSAAGDVMLCSSEHMLAKSSFTLVDVLGGFFRLDELLKFIPESCPISLTEVDEGSLRCLNWFLGVLSFDQDWEVVRTEAASDIPGQATKETLPSNGDVWSRGVLVCGGSSWSAIVQDSVWLAVEGSRKICSSFVSEVIFPERVMSVSISQSNVELEESFPFHFVASWAAGRRRDVIVCDSHLLAA